MLNNLRNILQPILEKIGKVFASTGLSPNFWTGLGLLFAILSAIIYGLNIEFGVIFGGLLLLASGFFDVVDGQVARITGKTSKTGSYLDSMFDKIAEVSIFFGILLAGYAQPSTVMLAITLSLLVSYARAKSDSLNIKMQGIGIGERAERLLVIAILGIIGFIEYAVIIVIIISGITLIQRMVLTVKRINEKSN